MSNEFSDIGSVKALLDDARERIKESEERSTKKIEDTEKRVNQRLDEVETIAEKSNLKLIEWLPLLTTLNKTEENRRNITLLLLVAFVSNIASWVLTVFVWYMKSGGVKP